MTRPEWIEIVQEMRALWPQAEVPDMTIGAWYREVEDLPADQVSAALRTFSRDGDEWPPTGGKLRRRVAELVLDPPDWGEVLEQLRVIQRTPPSKAGRVLNLDTEDPDEDYEVEILRPRDNVIAHTHPMIVAFFLHLGSQVVTGVDPNDGNQEARLREKWADFKRRAERRLSYTGLECADLTALQQASRRSKEPREASSVFKGIAKQIARPALPPPEEES